MMSMAAFMVGCFEESATQASSVAEDENSSVDSSSSKKSSSSKTSKTSSSSKEKRSHSSSSARTAPRSSSSIKVVFNVGTSSSVALPTVIFGNSSSSQQMVDIGGNQPMSSIPFVPDPENPPITNSSASTAVVTGLGSCRPSKSPINKGESTTWSFTPNPAIVADYGAIAFAQATYTWDFGDLSEEGSGISTTSGKVTYASSGKFGASVTVSVMNRSTQLFVTEMISCAPLQVNGDPIVGCKCTTDEAVVDFTATPTVTWTVSGCTSNSSIVSYEWNGVAGTTAFTQTFTSAANAYAPTLRVANDDNTIADVTCDAVKVTDGPEYEINQHGNASDGIDLPAGISKVHLNLPKDDYFFECMVYCQSNSGEISISVDGKTARSGYFVSLLLPDEKCLDQVVEFELSVPARCSIH